MKTCTKCGVEKDEGEFSKNTKNPSGLQCHCKSCYRQWREFNREKKAASNKRWAEANSERLKAERKANYIANKRAILDQNRAWRKANPQKKAEAKRAWDEANPEKVRASKKKWKENNKETTRAYEKKRIADDPKFRFVQALRRRVKNAFRSQNARKSVKSLDVLGCSPAEGALRLERQFQPGMTWENHGFGPGKWHIDHIRPVSSFDLSDPEQVRACFHFTNLQPLWQEDNLRKSDKWES